MVRSAPSTAIDFVAFDFFKTLISKGGKERVNDLQLLCAGAMAGASSTALLYPLEVNQIRPGCQP